MSKKKKEYVIIESTGNGLYYETFPTEEAAREYLEDEENECKMILITCQGPIAFEDHT